MKNATTLTSRYAQLFKKGDYIITEKETFKVVKVIDGDTLYLRTLRFYDRWRISTKKFFRNYFYLMPLTAFNYWQRKHGKIEEDELYWADLELAKQGISLPTFLYKIL